MSKSEVKNTARCPRKNLDFASSFPRVGSKTNDRDRCYPLSSKQGSMPPCKDTPTKSTHDGSLALTFLQSMNVYGTWVVWMVSPDQALREVLGAFISCTLKSFRPICVRLFARVLPQWLCYGIDRVSMMTIPTRSSDAFPSCWKWTSMLTRSLRVAFGPVHVLARHGSMRTMDFHVLSSCYQRWNSHLLPSTSDSFKRTSVHGSVHFQRAICPFHTSSNWSVAHQPIP